MSKKQSSMFKVWLAGAENNVKSASVKLAADQEAQNIKDPNEKGVVAIPDCGDGSNRTAQNLPANCDNMGEPNKNHNIMDVTKPNGVGQGQYVVPKDGTAADKAVTSPTESLDKLAQLKRLRDLQEAQIKQAAPAEFSLPASIQTEPTLMAKLASIGEVMMGTEAGQRAVRAVLEKQAGIEEARAIIAEAQNAIEKEAAAQYYANSMTENEVIMYKQAAAAQQAHAAWFNNFNTEMEKEAYANGADDGDAVADAVEAGADPSELAEVSDEEVLEYLQSLVESGQISQEEAESLLAALGDSAQDGLTGEEMAEAIAEAVQSGELTPEQGQAIAEQYLAQFADGAGDEDAAAMAAAGEDPAVQEAAAEAAEKTAAVINHLWTPGMA